MAFCTQCGHRLADGSKFCNECGSPIGQSQGTDEISLNVEISIRVVLKGEPGGNTEVKVYLPHLGKTVAVKVPNNISIGQSLRLRGQGHTSPDGEKGDAYIRVVQIDYDNTSYEKKCPVSISPCSPELFLLLFRRLPTMSQSTDRLQAPLIWQNCNRWRRMVS